MHTDNSEEYKTLGRPKGHALGGNPNDLLFCLNTGKLEVTRNFSLEKLVTHFIVRGTTSFYNQKLQLFPAGESERWNVSM